MLIIIYLLAVVLANLSVAWFGPSSTIVNAFLFIGLDLAVRDSLHEKWGKYLKRNMTLIILSGAILSYLMNHNAWKIALASCVAFALSETVKTLWWVVLQKKPRFKKVVYANAIASFVDSTTFPTIAFGVLMPGVILGQLVAKVAGAIVWDAVLRGTARIKSSYASGR